MTWGTFALLVLSDLLFLAIGFMYGYRRGWDCGCSDAYANAREWMGRALLYLRAQDRQLSALFVEAMDATRDEVTRDATPTP